MQNLSLIFSFNLYLAFFWSLESSTFDYHLISEYQVVQIFLKNDEQYIILQNINELMNIRNLIRLSIKLNESNIDRPLKYPRYDPIQSNPIK